MSDESYLDVGFDYSTDTLSAAEKASVLNWYRELHDHGDLDLSPFARFGVEHDPVGFKALKRHVESLGRTALPVGPMVLLWVHTYAALGNGKGTLYEIVAARALGASRAQVLETIHLAALVAGPLGMNPLGEIAHEYLLEWAEEESEPGLEWPVGWAPDVDRFRSGIDLSADGLTHEELELLRGWNRLLYGEVPPSLEYAARAHPDAYKTQQARFEKAVKGALPAQLIPLLSLHHAAIRQTPIPIRRSLQLARSLGVAREHVDSTLFWAAVYGGDAVFEAALEAAGDVLDDWRRAPT
jgi:alkylhydroperoxidase/carboxymuconolactone decarboxylase family protein YurZ